MLTGKGIVRAGYGNKRRRAKTRRVSDGDESRTRNSKSWILFSDGFLIPPYSLTNFEIQRYYQNESRFNGVYSRDNPPDKIKDEAYVISLDEYANIGTHWIVLYALNNDTVYFDSFGVEHIPKEIKRFLGNKNITTITFRVQTCNSVMCGYRFCIEFIDHVLAGKTLIDYTSLFLPHNFKKNDKIILSYFKNG